MPESPIFRPSGTEFLSPYHLTITLFFQIRYGVAMNLPTEQNIRCDLVHSPPEFRHKGILT